MLSCPALTQIVGLLHAQPTNAALIPGPVLVYLPALRTGVLLLGFPELCLRTRTLHVAVLTAVPLTLTLMLPLDLPLGSSTVHTLRVLSLCIANAEPRHHCTYSQSNANQKPPASMKQNNEYKPNDRSCYT